MEFLLSIDMELSHAALGAVMRRVSASCSRLLWQALRPQERPGRVRLLLAVSSDVPADVLALRVRDVTGVTDVGVIGRGRVDGEALERQLVAADRGGGRSGLRQDLWERMVVSE